jgi:hypothetical protein
MSVPVELDYFITPGDWDKPLYGVLFGLWPHTMSFPQTSNKKVGWNGGGTEQNAKNMILL